MRTRAPLRATLVYLVLSTPLMSAFAQGTVPDCGRDPICKGLFDQGRQQSSAGNLPEALRLYKQAYDRESDPALLFSIGRVLHKQGNADEAARYYEKFLASGLQDLDQRRKAQTYLSQLQPAGSTMSPTTAELTSPTPAAKAAKDAKPVYKKWWFWTILGTVAAAGIAGGVAGGVVANQPPEFRPF